MAEAAQGPPRRAVNCGWVVERWAGETGEWVPRWCVLLRSEEGATLQSFTDASCAEKTEEVKFSKGSECKMFADVSGQHVSDYTKGRPFGLVVTDKQSQDTRYLDAESGEAVAVWMQAFEMLLAKEDKPSGAPGGISIRRSSVGKGAATAGALKSQLASGKKDDASKVDMDTPLTVILFGATGDLARKKLYPAVYQLMFGAPDAPLFPRTTKVVGYGRSTVDLPKFLEKQCVNVKGKQKEAFLAQCSFFAGAYDAEESYEQLNTFLQTLEGGGKANRIFFFSVPPTIFGDVCRCVKAKATAPNGGYTRLIIEKPFGRDSTTFAELNAVTSASFSEDSIFRIDHYLGKEVVLNLTTMRFGNQLFEAIWNRDHIASIQIVFKEDLGTGGRGGYFDKFGIIRDIMQNHLLQVLLWIAMEPPETLSRDNVAAEKVKLLKAVKTLGMEDCFIGQYGSNSWTLNGQTHFEPGYLEDNTVPEGSKCPTYAAVVLKIDNDRWRDVPFLMRAGKGLDERMAEVRVTFKKMPFNNLVPGGANELVMRIQPEEAIYLKCMNKMPGWHQDLSVPVVLDMSYSNAFPTSYVADAYERMFLNTFKGDGSLFVGSDELVEAWRVFTPLLKEIDEKKPDPVIYPFGVRVPPGCDDFVKKYGIVMGESWQEYLAHNADKLDGMTSLFESLDKDGDGIIAGTELRAFVTKFFDGREVSDKQIAQIMGRLDLDGDGKLTLAEVAKGVELLAQATAESRGTSMGHK